MNKRTIGKQKPTMGGVVEGKPIRVGTRELVPLVRVTGRVRRQAFVGSDRVGAQGWGFVRMRPVAILERDEALALSEACPEPGRRVEGCERRIPIEDKTAQALGGLLLAALVIPLLLALAVRLVRKI
ncbi:MAG: hypothetical protein ISS49_09700 [Anaerolineae bacterium]|nr:hypothetical protein [Anaerolineae bacterium]